MARIQSKSGVYRLAFEGHRVVTAVWEGEMAVTLQWIDGKYWVIVMNISAPDWAERLGDVSEEEALTAWVDALGAMESLPRHIYGDEDAAEWCRQILSFVDAKRRGEGSTAAGFAWYRQSDGNDARTLPQGYETIKEMHQKMLKMYLSYLGASYRSWKELHSHIAWMNNLQKKGNAAWSVAFLQKCLVANGS